MRCCFKCWEPFCIDCKVPWHKNLSCEDYKRLCPNLTEDVVLNVVANQKKWRQCNNCKHLIERSGGCYRVTCRYNNSLVTISTFFSQTITIIISTYYLFICNLIVQLIFNLMVDGQMWILVLLHMWKPQVCLFPSRSGNRTLCWFLVFCPLYISLLLFNTKLSAIVWNIRSFGILFRYFFAC